MRVIRCAVALSCFFFLFTLLTFNPAHAEERCYTRVEAEAEQGIRIHSELMVIGLNCMHMSGYSDKNLYTKHQEFTAKHQKLFADYERIMMEYLRLDGDKNPEAALHSMRTKFANKISNDVATMRPDIFCKTYAERIEKVSKMDGTALRKWASTPFSGHPVSRRMCE